MHNRAGQVVEEAERVADGADVNAGEPAEDRPHEERRQPGHARRPKEDDDYEEADHRLAERGRALLGE